MNPRLIIAAAVAAQLGASASAYAYNPHTHAWITRKAAERLMAEYPGKYDELALYLDDVAFGALDEDNLFTDGDEEVTTLRVMRHFYRPTDGAGLFYGGQQFPSSYEWGYIGSEGNTFDWQDGLTARRRGDKKAFYTIAGHMAHFIEDCTVPAHTHLDDHGPPHGEDYEHWAQELTTDDEHAALPLPPATAKIPIFADAREAWQSTALASYWRSMYPGYLDTSHHEASGMVTQVYPALSWDLLSDDFTISDPAVGTRGTDFWQEGGGYIYFKSTAYVPAVDRVGFDPRHPERVAQLAPRGKSMAAAYGEDLVPFAVLQAAGVMKLYLDQGYAIQVETVGGAEDEEEEPEPIAAANCRIATRGGGPALAPLLLGLFAVVLGRRRGSSS